MSNTLNFVHETTSTSGTGTYTLGGAVAPKVSFVVGAGKTAIPVTLPGLVYYYCRNGTDFERGVGTLTDGGGGSDTLARTSILQSSNSDAAVNWPASGQRDIYSFPPASALGGGGGLDIYDIQLIGGI